MVTAVEFEPRDQRQRYDGGQQRKRARNGTIPLLFLGIIEVLTNPTKGETLISSGMIEANPVSHIQVYYVGARCQVDTELPGEKTSVKVVQLMENEELKGFKCRITSHKKSYYCGLFSYSKPIPS